MRSAEARRVTTNGANLVPETPYVGRLLENRRGVGDVIATRRRDIVPSPFRRVLRLAWPVEAWRVVAPVASRHDVNILEMAVLRLVGAGVGRPEAVAHWLNLHSDLVTLIMTDCARPGREYLAISSRPAVLTENGRKVIMEGEIATDSDGPSHDGWIFRDCLSGDVCPLFHEGTLPATGARQVGDLFPLPTSRRTEGKSQIIDRPHPRFVHAALAMRHLFQGLEESSDPPAGSMDEYTSAMPEIPDYLEVPDEKNLKNVSGPQKTRSGRSSPRRVVIVSDRPEMLDFEVLYYITANDPDRWLVTAPLQGAGGSWYAEKLAWARGRSHDLDAQMLGWERETKEQFAHIEPPTAYEEVLSDPLPFLDDEEGSLLAAATSFTAAMVPALPDLASSLLQDAVWDGARTEWEGACKRYALVVAGATFMLPDVLSQYQKTLEAVLNVFLEDVPDKRTLAGYFGLEGFGPRVRGMASEMGVEMPWAMSGDGYAAKMMAVARGRADALRPRALFLFLDAYDDGRAPFCRALQEDPGLLALIDRVAELRNRHAAHHNASSRASSEAEPASVEQEARQATCRVIEIMVAALSGQRSSE